MKTCRLDLARDQASVLRAAVNMCSKHAPLAGVIPADDHVVLADLLDVLDAMIAVMDEEDECSI